MALKMALTTPTSPGSDKDDNYGLREPSSSAPKSGDDTPAPFLSPRAHALLLFSLSAFCHALLVAGFVAVVILRYKLPNGTFDFSSSIVDMNIFTETIYYKATDIPNTIIKVGRLPTVLLSS